MSYPKLTPIITKGATEPRYLEDRFADIINVKDFGAKGDGTIDDTAAIQAAIDSGGHTVVFPAGLYLVSDTIILPDSVQSIMAHGATIKRIADKPIFYKVGSVYLDSMSNPTASISAGQDFVSLEESDLAKYEAGDWIFVRSGDMTPNVTSGSRPACLRRVKGKSLIRAYVESAFFRNMSLLVNDYKLRICKVSLGGRVSFNGGTYTSIDQTSHTTLFDFLLCYAPDFINITIQDSGGPGIRIAHCIGGSFVDSHISNLLDDKANWHLGYGILLCGSCIGFSVESGTIKKCRHGITTASVVETIQDHPTATPLPESSAALLQGCGEPEACFFGPVYIYECTNSGVNTHEQGYEILITPNIDGCFDGIHIRNSDTCITGGQIVNCKRYGIRFSDAASHPTDTGVINCTINATHVLNTAKVVNALDEKFWSGIYNDLNGTNLHINGVKIFGFEKGIEGAKPFSNLVVNNCEIDSGKAVTSQTGICLNGEQCSIFNTTIENCYYGIDSNTHESEYVCRHVTFNNCTYNVYPENCSMSLNEHDVPRDYFISGRYYSSGNGGGVEAATCENGSCWVSPIYVKDAITVSAMAVNVTQAGSSGSVVRLGIYDDNGSGYPNKLVIDAGTVDSTSTGAKEITGLSTTLAPGLYWLAAAAQGSPSTDPKLTVTKSTSFTVGSKTAANCISGPVGYGQAASGAFPASFVADQETVLNAPKIAIKIS